MATNQDPTDSVDDILRALDHDLRNPVSNIMGYVDLLRETPGAVFSGDQLEFLDRIEENCRTLLDLFERLRNVTTPSQ